MKMRCGQYGAVCLLLLLLLFLAGSGCKRQVPEPESWEKTRSPATNPGDAAPERSSSGPAERPGPRHTGASAPLRGSSSERSFRWPAAPRIVAFGDVHGDLGATRAALRLAGAVDGHDRWKGGEMVVVQTGDQLDRGDQEREVLDLLDHVATEAKAAGGALLVLNGNHEVMNVAGDFRYVTVQGFGAYTGAEVSQERASLVREFPEPARGRAAAFLPGGAEALRLADRPVALVVGDSVFVHGGLLPAHLEYGIARLNREAARWMRGEGPQPRLLVGEDSPVWTRAYSEPSPSQEDCALLGEVLGQLSAKRMVVGHTVQKEGISSACEDRVWRIDVGLAQAYGGALAVLEILGQRVRPIASEGAP